VCADTPTKSISSSWSGPPKREADHLHPLLEIEQASKDNIVETLSELEKHHNMCRTLEDIPNFRSPINQVLEVV